MIPIQKCEFTINMEEGQGFAEIKLRQIPVSLISVPTDNQVINEEFCMQVIECYMKAVEKITEWE